MKFVHAPERQWKIESIFEPALQTQNTIGIFREMQVSKLAPGHCDPGTLNLLYFVIASLRPSCVLEVGTHIGMGSLVIGSALALNGYGKLLTIEPQEIYRNAATDFLRRAALQNVVEILPGFSYDQHIKDRLSREGTFDVIYIDAAHDYASVINDISLAAHLLVDNGILILHDTGEASNEFDATRRGGPRSALYDFCKTNPLFKPIFFEYPFWMNRCGAAIVCKQVHDPATV